MTSPPVRSRKMAEKRLRRLRSAPRVISITNDFGTDTPMLTMRALNEAKPQEKIRKPRGTPRPVLMHTIKMRPEARTELPPSSRTTVLTLPERDTAPRMNVPRRKMSSELALRSRSIAVNSNGSPSNTMQDHRPPVQSTKPSQIRARTTQLRGDGLELSAGETHLWKLTNRGVPKSPNSTSDDRPTLHVDGDQGVRVSFMTMVGDPIQEFEIPPHAQPITLNVPPGTGLVAAIGLGGAGVIPETLEVGPGGILPEISTFNRPGIGFHPSSTVVQVSPFNYLCRGSSMRVKYLHPGHARGKRYVFSAMHVLDKQPEIEMFLPSTIDNLAIFISGEGDEEEVLSVALGDLIVTGEPHQIKRNGSRVFLWDVAEEVETASLVKVLARVADGWVIDSIIGLRGPYDNWLKTLTDGRWSGLVEEGPLTSKGDSLLKWRPPNTPAAKRASMVPSSKMKRADIPQPAPAEKTAKKGIYDLGELELGNEFKRDVSSLAADDDMGDIITFSRVSGAEFLSVSPEGTIIGVPTEIQPLGRFEFVVRVSDSEGAHADATFYGTVINPNDNTSPYWKEDER